MQPEASRRACVVKEPLSSYRGACRSTWAVTAEGQSPEAQPRADHDLFPSSGGAGLRACEGWAQRRALPAPTDRSPAPAALPGTHGCWLLVLEGSTLARQPLPVPPATSGAQSGHRLAPAGVPGLSWTPGRLHRGTCKAF